jgi:hypothetical protein
MPGRVAASFIDEVPEYEIRDGHMHISMAGTRLVMPVHVFRAGMAKANRALDDWFERQSSVVPLRVAGDH